MALEIDFDYKLIHYKILSTENKISFKGQFSDLSLVKKDCNQHIIKKIQSKFRNYLKADFKNSPVINGYTIQIDQKVKYDFSENNRATFFIYFESYFKTLKLEEKLSCGN
jgi:molecular chaperone DnaK (HSP70)